MNEYLKNLNRLEFIVTMACTGRCKHCSEGSHDACKEHLDGGAMKDAIQAICNEHKIESLMVFGGEPLLYPRDVRAISFDPNGDVLGRNVYSENILDILREYSPK